MKIGIASHLSVCQLQGFLDEKSAKIAKTLSENYAPSVSGLVEGFLKAGHELVIYTKDPQASRSYKLTGPKLTVYVVPALHRGWRKVINKLHITELRLILDIWKHQEPVDILSVHWTRDYAFAARKFLKICPVTVTVRDIIPLISKMQPIGWTTKMWNEITMRNPRFHFIANSDYTQAMIKHYWNKDSTVIYNSISDLFLDYKEEEKYKDYTFVSISNSIDGRKNMTKLMEAFRIVHTENPATHLILIGPLFTDTNENVKEWKEQKLCEGVTLAGSKSRKEIKTILTKSHCLVHPSVEETFGNIIIEAMASRCLVIGGKEAGAVPYVLKHGERGILCDVHDANSIADSMREAIRKDYTDMKEKAFQAVHHDFSGEKVCNDYLSYFEVLIQEYSS